MITVNHVPYKFDLYLKLPQFFLTTPLPKFRATNISTNTKNKKYVF